MKHKFIVLIILLHFAGATFSQNVVPAAYNVSSISDNLKKEANAVYRLDEAVLQVLSPSKYTLKVHNIITILNKEGAYHLQQSLAFNKFNSVDDIEIKIFSGTGNELQKYRKKDFLVRNYSDGFSLATDEKIMHLAVAAPEFPCTIDVNYSLSVSSYIDLPDWYINNSASSVEQFKYTVKVPDDLDIRYRTVNMQLTPSVEDNGKEKVYTWEAKDVAVKKLEAGAYEGAHTPRVEVSPNYFEYDGYKGGFKNWSEFGKWNYALYEEKSPFSEERISQIKALVKELPDEASKIDILYKYLKTNMRYVSIQFGIGGYKPFTTRFVDEKKYGDCKALTNYMRNLLAVAGIKSYPTLINAGYKRSPLNPEFPENVFNHVILCIPHAKDSTWLECTSTNSAAGFLGSFTENKNALLLTENGGVIVRTPLSNYNSNVLTTVNDIYVNAQGGGEVVSKLCGTGGFKEVLNEVGKLEEDTQNELFVSYLHYKEPDQFRVVSKNEDAKNSRLTIKFAYSKLFDFSAGNKLFFPKSVSVLCSDKLSMQDTRRTEYVFDYPYKKSDTTIFHFPAEYKIDNLPESKDVSSEFIDYKREAIVDAATNTIKIISGFNLKGSIIPPEEYKNICRLFNEVEKEETNKLVLKKG